MLQLTPDQERRIQSLVDRGVFPSPEQAVSAALLAIEQVVPEGFEGTPKELEALLLEGLSSGEPIPVDDAFWARLDKETDEMVREYESRKSRS